MVQVHDQLYESIEDLDPTAHSGGPVIFQSQKLKFFNGRYTLHIDHSVTDVTIFFYFYFPKIGKHYQIIEKLFDRN